MSIHRPSLLGLPPSIRYRIYENIEFQRCGPLELDPIEDFYKKWNHSLYNVLLTCRTIYAEASSMLYSINKLLIRYRDSGSFQPLQNLTAASLASVTCLILHFNLASCPLGTCCRGHRCEGHSHDQPLAISSPSYKTLLSEWRSTASYLADHIKPSRVQLHFICDTEDLETARSIVEPLLDLPRLAYCNIRLGSLPIPSLQDLAQDVATRLVRSKRISQFRLMDLPPELRLKVLEYTDLITPLGEVYWSSSKGYHLEYLSDFCGGYEGPCNPPCPPPLHYACQFRHCFVFDMTGCFCRRYHAAFSTRCSCWAPPTPLFSVCRALREESERIFWSKNRFIICPSEGHFTPPKGTPSRLAASIFLTDIVPSNIIHRLRFLEILFPPFDTDYLLSTDPAYTDWEQTLDYVKDKLNLSRLTLRVYIQDIAWRDDVPESRKRMKKEDGLLYKLIGAYARVMKPFCKLHELNRFYLHCAWPLSWTWWGRRLLGARSEKPEKQIRQIEEFLGKRVFGDNYESKTVGKDEERSSQWLERREWDDFLYCEPPSVWNQ